MNAISSGTAVSASATLCRVSPSSATDPDSTTTTALDRGGDGQADQADQQRPPPGAVGFERVVDLVGGVVGMPTDHFGQPMRDGRPARTAVIVVVIMVEVLCMMRDAGARDLDGRAHPGPGDGARGGGSCGSRSFRC